MITRRRTFKLNPPRRFGFDNSPRLKYNPLYIKGADPALTSVPGAI